MNFEPRRPALPEHFDEVLDEVLAVLRQGDVPHVFGGGVAAIAYGLRQTTHDIDVFVRPDTASRVREVFRQAGFRTWIEDPVWLGKALRHGVEIDLVHESRGPVHIGDETLARAPELPVRGRQLRVLPPEDFFVMKALVGIPGPTVHLLDALGVLKRGSIDWLYLSRLILPGNPAANRKILRALIAASDQGVEVPGAVLVELIHPLLD
ncbi:MAG: nucleotidyltransferase [Chloroflexi bacterium]|nr:nucleotidyltransferase [Chloroflexota bacterium]